ncbi:MAG: hypothetical protein U0790_12065 [Isosphaeraceae bacterium]
MTMRSRRGEETASRLRAVGIGLGLGLGLLGLLTGSARAGDDSVLDTKNDAGQLRTITLDGSPLDDSGPFFQSLGTNGRTCFTCHVPAAAWAITPAEVQQRFRKTNGLDPIFRLVDGANSPLADVSSKAARAQAYSMLLNKGVIRVGRPMPAGADFTLVAVDDPWGYASAAELSLFRRPMPTTNLRFLTGVMWDSRESTPLTGTVSLGDPPPAGDIPSQVLNHGANLLFDLKHQAQDATLGHAEAMVPGLTEEQMQAIVDFEMNLATAQTQHKGAGKLTLKGAKGGPELLATVAFYVSMNDSSTPTLDVFGNPFNSVSMTLFDAWQGDSNKSRASIARGATIFNTFVLNDAGARCTNCHGVPNVGSRSLNRMVNLNVSDESRRYPGLPLYTFQKISTGETVKSTDPGQALTTGKFADIGKFKVPVLRGLAARAPYFHNGMAATLDDVLTHYELRFGFVFTSRQRADLIEFLLAL